MQPTTDPLAGFLPPNKTSPEGEGSVLFTISPKQSLQTNAEIRNSARIVFDVNAPIDTPVWLNTIDNSLPASHVTPLAATQSSVIFNVSWTGADTGSGIQNYTVLVSENGAPFTLWQSETTATSATFIGQPGKTYAFYSVARDWAGNLEPAKTSAEATTATPTNIQNSIDDARFFVRQHYLDFLNREPDQGGWDYWTQEITKCGADAACVTRRRTAVSAAFFIELEFQESGAFVYRIYKAALATTPGYRPSYAEFILDRSLVVGGASLAQGQLNFATSFVGRSAFTTRYPTSLTRDQFIEALIQNIQQNSGANLSTERANLIGEYDSGANQTDSRARVLRRIGTNETLRQAEFNRAFVLVQYFGYLRRDPDQGGYDFWLNILNNQLNNSQASYHAMVCAFITSAEYQLRFGQVATYSNRDCSSQP